MKILQSERCSHKIHILVDAIQKIGKNLLLEVKYVYLIMFIDSKALNYDRNKCKIECTYNFKEMRFKLEYFEQKQYTLCKIIFPEYAEYIEFKRYQLISDIGHILNQIFGNSMIISYLPFHV